MSYDIKVVEMGDMRVAAFRADGPDPEAKAFQTAMAWAWESGVLGKVGTRVFGFDIPSQKASHGYEVWVTLDEGVEAVLGGEVKMIPGAKYAAIECDLSGIEDAWKAFMETLRAEGFTTGSAQCLEEHLLPATIIGPGLKFEGIRLLEPIA